ncbi:MAG TPA: T9SS type A sorting domain-containing protein, partial [Candidatus Cloacimonetes bacterium]|nr:T9SS type A sorting domain-containing protein [Candidatus Cloacimonadota bacterium]
DNELEFPAEYSLSQNYPNPFNPSGAGHSPQTHISYAIPIDSDVKLVIYNIKGQKVKTLIDEKQEKGFKQIVWDGTNNNQKSVSSGIYFYKLETEDYSKVKKMILLR